ncbi:Atu4866 domain-containing protein [Kineococcus sp. NUM-3379]
MHAGRTGTGRDEVVLEQIRERAAGTGRPLLLSGGTVVTGNPRLGSWERADVLVGGTVVVGVGPGLLTAAGDDDMLVLDCTGCVVLPARLDLTDPASAGTLTPGSPADVAVVRTDGPATPEQADPRRGPLLDVLVVGGEVRVWRGTPLDGDRGGAQAGPPAARRPAEEPWTGTWVDETGFLHQELRPDGRYDETRGGRPHAFQGRYWVDGDRVDYLDDLGFWAFGEFRDGVLHHAGYRMRRR